MERNQIYFLQTGPFLSRIGILDSQIGPAMTIGQFAEILTMVYLGFFLKRLGFHKVISIGIAAYFIRYAIFGTESLPFVVAPPTLTNSNFSMFQSLISKSGDAPLPFFLYAQPCCTSHADPPEDSLEFP